MEKAYIFTSPGSDPGLGRHLVDPIFGTVPTMGACRPDLRRNVRRGDHIFVVSGRVEGADQYIIGGFEVDEKIKALAAHARFPTNRLSPLPDGGRMGNVIVDEHGQHHPLDPHDHKTFEKRIENYIVGKNPIYLAKPEEIALARHRTLEILKDVFGRPQAKSIHEMIGRNRRLDEDQVKKLIAAINAIKTEANRGLAP